MSSGTSVSREHDLAAGNVGADDEVGERRADAHADQRRADRERERVERQLAEAEGAVRATEAVDVNEPSTTKVRHRR